MSLFSRQTTTELPGIIGATRDGSRPDRLAKKLREGDIVVLDAPDIDRATAQALIDAKVAAVLNTSQFTTGAVPNFGPQMLLDAGIVLVEGVSNYVFEKLKDGRQGRLDDTKLFYGDRRIAEGNLVTEAGLATAFDEARTGLADRMEAFSGNLVEFTRHEAPLYIDGLGVPDLPVNLRGEKVLIVTPGHNRKAQLKELRFFIREYEPILVGVDGGADVLSEAGYTPHLIVGDPEGIREDTLRSGAKVILPAEPDGTAVGLERIQDLGIGAMTFPALTSDATDLALLLAEYHRAAMIVLAGDRFDLDDLFEHAEKPDTPSTLLARLKAGNKLVDARMIAELYEVKSSGFGVAWAILGIFVLLAAIILIAGMNGDGSVMENLIDTWNSIALWFQGLFK